MPIDELSRNLIVSGINHFEIKCITYCHLKCAVKYMDVVEPFPGRQSNQSDRGWMVAMSACQRLSA